MSNAIAGPGIPFVTSIFQQSGWFIVSFLFVIFYFFFTQSALFVLVSLRSMPGNKNFQGSVEYSTIATFYLNKTWSMIGKITLHLSNLSECVQSIVISAQVCDELVLSLIKRNCALVIKNTLKWKCIENNHTGKKLYPFEDSFLLISIGLIVSMNLCTSKEN